MIQYVPLILFTVLTNAVAQIMLKRGMNSVGVIPLEGSSLLESVLKTASNPFIIIGIFTFVISLVSHIIVLSRVDLSFAYPFLSLAYVVVVVYAYLVFHENVNTLRVAGLVMVCAGTFFIARS